MAQQQIPFHQEEQNVFAQYQKIQQGEPKKIRSGILERYTYKTDNGELLKRPIVHTINSSNSYTSGLIPINRKPQNSTGETSNFFPTRNKVTSPVRTYVNMRRIVHSMGNSSKMKDDEKVRTEHCDSTTDILENFDMTSSNLLDSPIKQPPPDDDDDDDNEQKNCWKSLEDSKMDPDSDCEIIGVSFNHVSNNMTRCPSTINDNTDKGIISLLNLNKDIENLKAKVLNWIKIKPEENTEPVIHIISDDSDDDDDEEYLCDKTGVKTKKQNNTTPTSNETIKKSEPEKSNISIIPQKQNHVTNTKESAPLKSDANQTIIIQKKDPIQLMNEKLYRIKTKLSREFKSPMISTPSSVNYINSNKNLTPPKQCSASMSSPKNVELTPPATVNIQKSPKLCAPLSPESMKSEFYSYLKINTNPSAQKAEKIAQNRRSTRVKNLILQIERNKKQQSLKTDNNEKKKERANEIRKKFMKYSKPNVVFPSVPLNCFKYADFDSVIEAYIYREKIPCALYQPQETSNEKNDASNTKATVFKRKYKLRDRFKKKRLERKYIQKKRTLVMKKTRRKQITKMIGCTPQVSDIQLRRLRFKPNRIFRDSSVRITRRSLDGYKVIPSKTTKLRKPKLNGNVSQKEKKVKTKESNDTKNEMNENVDSEFKFKLRDIKTLRSDKPTIPSNKSDKPIILSDKPTVQSDKPTFQSDKPTVLSDKQTFQSDKPTVLSDKPTLLSDKPKIESERSQIETKLTITEAKCSPTEALELKLQQPEPKLTIREVEVENKPKEINTKTMNSNTSISNKITITEVTPTSSIQNDNNTNTSHNLVSQIGSVSPNNILLPNLLASKLSLALKKHPLTTQTNKYKNQVFTLNSLRTETFNSAFTPNNSFLGFTKAEVIYSNKNRALSPVCFGFEPDEKSAKICKIMQEVVSNLDTDILVTSNSPIQTPEPIEHLVPEIRINSIPISNEPCNLQEVMSIVSSGLSSSQDLTPMLQNEETSSDYSEASSAQEELQMEIALGDLIDPSLIEKSNSNVIPLNQNIKTKSFHRSLMQTRVKQKSFLDVYRTNVFEQSDSDSSMATPKANSSKNLTHGIDINSKGGAMFTTYYVNGILIIVQEFEISFWKQTALGNILGAQNMWLPNGSLQRIILERGCINRRSSEMVLSYENSIAYIELWTKQHESKFRECPIADVFATIYFHRGHGIPDKKVLQLENIKGYGHDVRFVVIKSSREIIVSWCDTFAEPIKTLVRCYQLAPDFQTVCSVKEMECINHCLISLHNIQDCDDLVLGAGNEQISVWNLRHGYLVTTLNLADSTIQSSLENKSLLLYAQCDTGFLFLIQQIEVGVLRLVAVNGMTQEWKQLQSYQVPPNYKELLGIIVESGVLMTCYTNGFLCWNMNNGQILAEIEMVDNIVLPTNKYLVAFKDYQVKVQHIMSYILTHDW